MKKYMTKGNIIMFLIVIVVIISLISIIAVLINNKKSFITTNEIQYANIKENVSLKKGSRIYIDDYYHTTIKLVNIMTIKNDCNKEECIWETDISYEILFESDRTNYKAILLKNERPSIKIDNYTITVVEGNNESVKLKIER